MNKESHHLLLPLNVCKARSPTQLSLDCSSKQKRKKYAATFIRKGTQLFHAFWPSDFNYFVVNLFQFLWIKGI